MRITRSFAAALVLAACLSTSHVFAAGKALTVAADGSGEFKTVQAAVDAVPDGNREPVVIYIKPGTYKEKITVPKGKPFVTFKGEDAKATVLTNDWNAKHVGPEGKEVGTFGSSSVLVEAPDFVAENVTFENSAGNTGQAVALSAVGDRQVYRNCRLLGWQDTLYANGGRQYYDRCDIEGRVDFIFGNAVAVFDHCTIHSKNGGYVTAASTPQDHPFGFVFMDCKLTGDDAPWPAPPGTPNAKPAKPNKMTYLGRPWRAYGSVTFIHCELGDHIRPEGWHNWGKPDNEKTARYAEYGNTGPGANADHRVPWSKQLAKEEVARITVEKVLGGADGWKPRP